MCDRDRCEQSEVTCAYAAQALAASEIAAAEAHIASCPDCQRELESLRPVVDRFVSWPTDVLRPTPSLQARLALRIAEETGKEPVLPPARQGEQTWSEPEWEAVAPGIACKLLATDTQRHRVSMLVRLAPGARRTSMLTRCRSVSVASRLHSIPGATCSHSGSDHCRAGGGTGCFPVSSAIRSARRACSDVVGRSTSVGQETNRSITGRRLSNSRRQSGHEAM